MALNLVSKETKGKLSPISEREWRKQIYKLLAVYCKIPRQSCLLHLFANCRRISPAVTNILKEVQDKTTAQNAI
jgi:hypothetical protein